MKLFREIGAQQALRPFMKAEMLPGAAKQSDAELDAAIRATAVTVHHPAGSCRMGADEMAVVDGELRVHGAQGLRVIDASVFPDLVGGNINAAVIMIAEKAADMIRGKAAAARANELMLQADPVAELSRLSAIVFRYRAAIASCCLCRPSATTISPPTITSFTSASPATNT